MAKIHRVWRAQNSIGPSIKINSNLRNISPGTGCALVTHQSPISLAFKLELLTELSQVTGSMKCSVNVMAQKLTGQKKQQQKTVSTLHKTGHTHKQVHQTQVISSKGKLLLYDNKYCSIKNKFIELDRTHRQRQTVKDRR